MILEEFDALIRKILSLDEFSGSVAFAVDACLESIRRAAEWKADLLFVHHGLFWGKPLAVTGGHYQRLRALIETNLALYAVHLPLDMHPELGNNAGLARRIGLQQLEPFGEYKGMKIGYRGRVAEEMTLEQVVRLCCGEQGINVLPFGPENISTVGIVSGGAADEAYQAIDERLDLFITGDADHTIYHHCLEGRINVIFGGHYLTETSGVILLAEKLEKETDLKTIFLDIPTGL
jgi:dinuclear metal center YbgI/SA1388 family protein